MISYLSKFIAVFFYNKEIIAEEKIDVCKYGFEIMISTIIGFLLVLFSGIVFNDVIMSMVFYFTFVFTRIFTGGYHATTHFRCKCTLLMCSLFVLIAGRILVDIFVIIILVFIYLITVWAYSPVEHINAPLTVKLKKRNRKISIIMAITFIPLTVVTFSYYPQLSLTISLTLFVIAILILEPKLQERRKKYEKNSWNSSQD